ncbi:MAG: hypothetical protein ACOX5Z_02005 [Desulfobulbus sp.]
MRRHDRLATLGHLASGSAHDNRENFPPDDVDVGRARPIYEIINPLPFRGCTFIDSGWADARAAAPERIALAPQPATSLRELLAAYCSAEAVREIIGRLPLSLRYDLAANSTDPDELVWLAESCCQLEHDEHGNPTGLCYRERDGRVQAVIGQFELFETIANNPFLPDVYKEVMVLRPGVQGDSPIVGDFVHGRTDILEYLRGNSYIPWGHYAANCAPDCIRYRIADLSADDMAGLRHLYYQRSYLVLAARLGCLPAVRRRPLSEDELEALRTDICARLQGQGMDAEDVATLWGWNFGYDISGSGYRLHASHQMIHQQYALVPQWVATGEEPAPAYSCGDQVAEVIEEYRRAFRSDFFSDYLRAINGNTRTDGGPGPASLVVWQDAHVQIFVPKAQVAQWELQLMVTADGADGPVGNIFEANREVRRSLDIGILKAQQALAGLGARMVTSIEYSKRLRAANGQRLLYAFLPKLPWAMGGFTEAQGRFILGHYPEDFALACRMQLDEAAHPPEPEQNS